MKKILLATTMLVGTAGFAAAEVSLSGDARMGVIKAEGADAVFSNRARVKFALSGETDSGLSFGASFRAGDAAGAASGDKGTVFISGAFGTLSMGDESAAAEYAVGDLAGVGYTGAGSNNETAYIASSKVVYTYTAGDLSVFLSAGQPGSDDYSVGAKYTVGGLTVGVGYEDAGADTHTVASAAYALGDTTFKVVYGKAKVADTAAVEAAPATLVDGVWLPATNAVAATSGLDTQVGASIEHKLGAVSLAAFYRTTENNAGVKSDFYGVGAAYDLGGGASVKAGIADNNDVSTVEAGVTFSF